MRLFEYPEYIENIIKRFSDAGEDAFIVGGCLRDSLLGKAPDDFDMATSALPEKTMEIFSDKKLLTMGLKHGTVTVIYDSHPVEITTFRIDGAYSDSRHPDAVRFTSRIEEDLSRRDFTVNAMAYNHSSGLVDPFGGRQDLGAKILRAVGEPSLRFDEDALRIMRAFRFSAQLGFEIEEKTLLGASLKKDGLASIARERIGVEFSKLLVSVAPSRAIGQMISSGIFDFVVKDYTPSQKVLDNIDVMPRQICARLGFLLCEADVERARALMRELRLSGKVISGAVKVVAGSSVCVDGEKMAGKFAARFGSEAPHAALASVLLGNSPSGSDELVRAHLELPHTLKDLKINGTDLLSLGFEGKDLGQTLQILLDKVILNPELNEKTALLDLAKNLKKGEKA